MNSLTESLHEELLGTGVHVTALCPGYTRTEFHDRADWDTGGVPSAAWGRAEDVARAGVDGVLANRAIVIPGAANRALGNLSRVLPSTVSRKVTKLLATRGDRH